MTTPEVAIFGDDTAGDMLITRDERVLWRRTSEAVLFVPPQGREPHTLRGAGCALWELLGEPRRMGDVVQQLAAAYRVPVDTVARDLVPIVQELTSLQVLRTLGPA